MAESMHDLTIMALSSASSQHQTTRASNVADEGVKRDSVSAKQQPNPAITNEVDTRQQLSKLIQAEKTEKASKKADKRTTFSVFAGQYFTYATGSETQSNNGVGFSSEIKINKNLRITTGASLGQNSLNFEKTVPTTAYMSYAERNSLKDALAPAFNSAVDSRYSINSFNAKLTGLDIPVNLKYYFNDPNQKQSIFYLSTGLSSNLFIKETYTYNVSQASGNNSLNLPNQRSTNSFESFDFARTLNVAVGIGRAISPRTNLTIEPFLKYPLSGLGTENLKFGSAGVNLKVQFEKKK
jgi:hypothetical protein